MSLLAHACQDGMGCTKTVARQLLWENLAGEGFAWLAKLGAGEVAGAVLACCFAAS